MRAISYGLLPWRVGARGVPEVFLVHPGGPFWRNREAGAWSIPKGLPEADESPRATARREFMEETGLVPPADAEWVPLPPVRLRGGKEVRAWAIRAPELDPAAIVSNTFEIEWPPRSGRRASFPEVDRAGWFPLPEARRLANPAYGPLFDEIARLTAGADGRPGDGGKEED